MINHLEGAGFNVTDKPRVDGEPDYDDYEPPVAYAVHEGEQNTRQGVTLHPKDEE